MPHRYRIVRDRSLSKLTRRWRFVGVLLILFCLLMAYLFWSADESSNLQLATSKFDQTINNRVDTFSKRVETYTDMLYAVRGLFIVKNDVSQADWTAFLATQSISERYPGINALAYVYVGPSRQLAQDGSKTLNLPAVGQIYPTPLTDNVGVVSYIDPYAKYSGTIGYNEFSSSARAAMLTRAGRDGVVRASSPLELVVSSSTVEKQAAIILALPVYKSGANLDTPDNRLAAVKGYVMESLYIKPVLDDFASTLTSAKRMSLSVSTTDGKVIYQNTNNRPVNYIEKTITIDIAGQNWQLNFSAPSDFGLDVASKAAPLVALVRGVAVSVVVFGLMVYASGLRFVRHRQS